MAKSKNKKTQTKAEKKQAEKELKLPTFDEAAKVEKAKDTLVKAEEIAKAKEALLEESKTIQVAELELRRYVRRGGGFRLGISIQAQKRAEFLMERLGRKEPEWDLSIVFDEDKELTS